MSHFLKPLLPDQEIVAEAQISGKAKFHKRDNEALHRHSLFEKPIQCRGTDGRTYDYIDENGKYVSHFISQLSPLISDNVEPGVRLLVRSLHAQGYLTMGSCQGHEDSRFRWVILVFPEEHQLNQFKSMVDGFGLPITWYDNFLNFREKPKVKDVDSFQLSFTWEQKVDSNRNLENLKQQGYTEAELTKYLNIMFCRNHTKYHLIKMVISSKMGDKNFFDEMKWKWLYRKRDEVTDALVEAILGTDPVDL